MELMLSLDPQSPNQATEILKNVSGLIKNIKIGHVLASQNLEECFDGLKKFDIFLDYKFLDIPNTVQSALKNYKKKIPTLKYFSIHGIAEDNLIKACVDLEFATPLSVISLSSNIGSENDNSFFFQVERNLKIGITHFVCPPNQVKNIKQKFNKDVIIFVPGIRNKNDKTGDHYSTINTMQAKELGVDFAIVGRPIIENQNVVLKLKEFLNEM